MKNTTRIVLVVLVLAAAALTYALGAQGEKTTPTPDPALEEFIPTEKLPRRLRWHAVETEVHTVGSRRQKSLSGSAAAFRASPRLPIILAFWPGRSTHIKALMRYRPPSSAKRSISTVVE